MNRIIVFLLVFIGGCDTSSKEKVETVKSARTFIAYPAPPHYLKGSIEKARISKWTNPSLKENSWKRGSAMEFLWEQNFASDGKIINANRYQDFGGTEKLYRNYQYKYEADSLHEIEEFLPDNVVGRFTLHRIISLSNGLPAEIAVRNERSASPVPQQLRIQYFLPDSLTMQSSAFRHIYRFSEFGLVNSLTVEGPDTLIQIQYELKLLEKDTLGNATRYLQVNLLSGDTILFELNFKYF